MTQSFKKPHENIYFTNFLSISIYGSDFMGDRLFVKSSQIFSREMEGHFKKGESSKEEKKRISFLNKKDFLTMRKIPYFTFHTRLRFYGQKLQGSF